MARGDRQVQSPAASPAAPAVTVPLQSGPVFGVPAGEPAAVTALRQRAEAFEQEAAMQESFIERTRLDLANRQQVAAQHRADAAACRDAIQRLSN